MSKPVVAIVNDEPTFRYVVSRMFAAMGFEPSITSHGSHAAAHITEAGASAVVIDATMQQALAATFLVECLRRDDATIPMPIVVCSPEDEFHRTYGEYLEARGCRMIGKPFDFEQVLEAVDTQPAIAAARYGGHAALEATVL